MGGLANFIERVGVATTSISLIREHSEAVGPPRALWVPFPLGRPLGVAGDADFQRRVLWSALKLLETASEPTITDFPEDVPEAEDLEGWACPVSFAAPNEGSLEQRLHAEVARLRPWAEETRRARGRTLLGASGGGTEDVDAMVSILAYVAEGGNIYQLPEKDGRGNPMKQDWWHAMPFLLRHLAEDVRIHYQEAVTAQPGQRAPDHRTLTEWIFGHTVFGETLTGVGEAITAVGERRLLTLRGYIIPEGFVEGDESFGKRRAEDPPGFQRAIAGNRYLRGEPD